MDIRSECQDLIAFLSATQTIREISPRSLDNIISRGEILSCRMVTALLQDQGVDAHFLDLSNIVNSTSLSQNLDQSYYDNLASLLYKKIQECGNKVPVVTGYFGNIPGGLLDKIGRGYTDLCAALIC